MTGNDTDLEVLAVRWRHHKLEEKRHAEERRKLEDAMVDLMALPADLDETRNREVGDRNNPIRIKVIGRIDRKVDADKVQEIAAEHGLESHLSTLFRWKPELNMRAWNNAGEAITRALSAAITVKPSRPSFAVTLSTDDKE